MSVYEKGLVTVVAVHALLIALSIPLAARKVRRNGVYGFRTRSTLSDDALWYDANAHFAVRMIVFSIVALLAFAGIYTLGNLAPCTYLNASVIDLAAPLVFATLLTTGFIRNRTAASGSGSRL